MSKKPIAKQPNRLPREPSYDAWGQPQTFADFIYEWRYRLESEKRIPRSQALTPDPLYDFLSLQGCVSRKEFGQIVAGEIPPTAALLERVRGIILAEHAASVLGVFDRSIQSEAQHLPHIINHPYRLAGILQSTVGGSHTALLCMAHDLDVYPSMLQALMRSEIIASPELREKICRYLALGAEESETIRRNNAEFAAYIQKASPEKAMLMRLLGSGDRHTTLLQLVDSLFYTGSPFSESAIRSQLQPLTMADGTALHPLDAIVQHRRDPSKTLRRRTYDAALVKPLASALSLTPAQQKIWLDIGTRRPIGELLEDYVLSGGISWSGFWQTVEQDWGVGSQRIAEAVGVSRAQLYQWMNRDASQPAKVSLNALEKLSEHTGLNKRQRDYLQALGAGDLSIGADFAEVVGRLQTRMATMTMAEREVFAGECFRTLLARSGKTPGEISRRVGGHEASIYTQSKEVAPYPASWIEVAHAVARTLCPERQRGLIEETALLLLGVPVNRTPSQMLEQVLGGHMSAGDMVREYRLQHGLGSLAFARQIGDYNETLYKRAEHAPVAKGKGQSPSVQLLKDLATHMNLDEQQTRLFIAAARGKEVVHQGMFDATLQHALAGDCSFAEIIRVLLGEHYGHLAHRDSVGAPALARDLGVALATVTNWLEGGKFTCEPDVMEKLCEIAGIAPDQRQAFEALARGKQSAAVRVPASAILVEHCDYQQRLAADTPTPPLSRQ